MAGQKERCTHFTPAQFWQDLALTPQRFTANYTLLEGLSCSSVANEQ